VHYTVSSNAWMTSQFIWILPVFLFLFSMHVDMYAAICSVNVLSNKPWCACTETVQVLSSTLLFASPAREKGPLWWAKSLHQSSEIPIEESQGTVHVSSTYFGRNSANMLVDDLCVSFSAVLVQDGRTLLDPMTRCTNRWDRQGTLAPSLTGVESTTECQGTFPAQELSRLESATLT